MQNRPTAKAIVLWPLAVSAWAALAIALYGSPAYGSHESQPIWVLAGLTLVLRYLLRGVADAWPIAILAAPALAFVVLLVVASFQ